ncbi:MAG TPA: DUF5990 family protein [Caldilineaceae bacterium]|nr:DUF5990 family protein [Caldilineaceae bacterium]
MSKTTAKPSAPVRLFCVNPPPAEHAGEAAHFGLQDKKQQIHEGSRQADGSLLFSFAISLHLPTADSLDFGGPFVHGKAGDRFLYLSWQRPSGTFIKRIKIPLTLITTAQIDAISTQGGGLTATVDGRGAARTKPLGDGWTVYAA